MKKLLVLFTKGFPYNTSEPFLENEYPLYKKYFDKVIIVTGCKRGEKPTRFVDKSFTEILSDYTLSKDFISILQAIPWILKDKMLYIELKKAFHKGFSCKRLYDLLVIAICGNYRAKLAYKWIKSHPDYSISVLYGYWMNIPTYAALKLKKMLKNPELRVVSRCHGFDIYSERHRTNYIPYQHQYVNQLDYIAPASQDGAKYLKNKYGLEKIQTWYLGAADIGKININTKREPLKIVSCARVVPVKRLERIVDALALVDNFPIEWTHFGGGDGLENLILYAKRHLDTKSNIKFHFKGTVSNHQIYQEYEISPFHVFVSVSASEGGAPISICEALSFGIPVIATAVGGQPEAVKDGLNGFLLQKDYEDCEFVCQLNKLKNMEEREYLRMRTKARIIFKEKFDATLNNKKFIEDVLID